MISYSQGTKQTPDTYPAVIQLKFFAIFILGTRNMAISRAGLTYYLPTFHP